MAKYTYKEIKNIIEINEGQYIRYCYKKHICRLIFAIIICSILIGGIISSFIFFT